VEWSAWLVEAGLISTEQFEDAVRLAQLRSVSLPDALLMSEYADRWTITRAFAVQHGYPQIDFYSTRISDEVIRTIPDVLVRDLEVCPVAVVGSVLWYATPHIADADHRTRLCHVLNRDARPMWAPLEWVCQAGREYHAVCHVTECRSGWMFAKYGDEDWVLVKGNRYRDYLAAGRTNRST
jgi:hypothetical protein